MYELLEHEYAQFVGSRYAVSCSSGTSALHLALLALNIGKEDEVIVPDFTMAACGFAVSYVGARVVTVDCKADLTIDPELIRKAITPRTKAIMAVHIYGRLCDMEKIIKIAREHHLKVIEDACEAQGAVFDSKADISCYSFYKNKIIHAEEGGIITMNNKEIADNIRDLKNMAFGDKHNYYHERIGYNYRLADSQAWMAIQSLRSYHENNSKRRVFEAAWHTFIPSRSRNAVWVYDFLCESAKEKEEKIIELNEKKIPWRHFFKPLSTFPMFKQSVGQNTLDYSNRGLYICYHD